MYNILEHKQAIAENIQKAFGDTPEDIEKAKWQIGEIRVDSRGIAHECYEYTAEGKPRLRRVKKNKNASTDDGGSITDNNGVEHKTKKVGHTNVVLSIVDKVVSDIVKKYPKGDDKAKDYAELKLHKSGLPWTVINDYLYEVMDRYNSKTNKNSNKKQDEKVKVDTNSADDKKKDNKKFTESSFKNSFDSIISNISSIVDKVYVEKPVGRDDSIVDKTYKTSDWKNGVHIVGNDFYGKSELLQLDINKKGGSIETIQLRKPISNGIGSSYNNQPIGNVIVEVNMDNNWVKFDMTKENSRKDFAELLNKNIKK